MSEEEKNHLSNSGLGDTWRASKISSENDPELKDQLDDIELADLKRKDFRFNPDVGKWCNAYGDRLTAGDAYRERQIVRLKAKKFIKNPKQLDKFMSAKSYDEYKAGPINAEWLFLHHTAGWHNPYNVIKQWDADKNGPISTEFVLGGPSCKGK